VLSPPQRLPLVNTSERKKREAGALERGNGSAGNDGKREKEREPLPDTVFKMAPDFRARLALVISFINTKQDGGTFSSTTAVLQKVFSLSARPFQLTKESSNTICFKCFEDDGLVNLFCRGS